MILFFCYNSFTHKQKYEDLAYQYLEDICEMIDDTTVLSYADGLCGIGTSIEFLLQNNFVAGNGNEILEEIDKKVASHIIHLPVSDCSLDQGLAGWGRYLFYRIKGSKSNLNSNITLHAIEYFIHVIDLIDYYKKNNIHLKEEIISFLFDAYQLKVINFKIEKLLRFFLEEQGVDLFFLEKALTVKEKRANMYIDQLRFQSQMINDIVFPIGMKDGYIGMGLTWFMDNGHVTNDLINLL
jgi:hypothetical protein